MKKALGGRHGIPILGFQPRTTVGRVLRASAEASKMRGYSPWPALLLVAVAMGWRAQGQVGPQSSPALPCGDMDVAPVFFGTSDGGWGCGGMLRPPSASKAGACEVRVGETQTGVSVVDSRGIIPFGQVSTRCGIQLACRCDYFRAVSDGGFHR
jgi:hypothetical protein